MKEDMYTYHYYRNRAQIHAPRTGNVLFQSIIAVAFLYVAVTSLLLITKVSL